MDRSSMKVSLKRIGWWWVGVNGIGMLIGAEIAMRNFPGAAFAANPTGKFGWHLVGFAFSIAIPSALAQWALLQVTFGSQQLARTSVLLLWIPISSVGLAAMIFPLWWWDATVFVFAPWAVVLPVLPGGILLGLGQWFVLRRIARVDFIWPILTVIGVAAGALVGLIIGFWFPLPLEITWAFIAGASIGVFQCGAMSDIAVSLRHISSH